MKVGFIGVGYMGYGIAKNLIKHGHKLIVVANKNRIPIDKIVYDGAVEVKNFEELCKQDLEILLQVVPISIWQSAKQEALHQYFSEWYLEKFIYNQKKIT